MEVIIWPIQKDKGCVGQMDIRQEAVLAGKVKSIGDAKYGKKLALRFKKAKEELIAYMFLAPTLILFTLFVFYPTVQSIYLSLHLTDPFGRISKFTGLENYKKLFTSSAFYDGLAVTAQFILYTVPTTILLALLLAILTHRALAGMKLFRFIFSLPVALSVGTTAVIWLQLYHPSIGMFNRVLSWFNIDPVFWLSDPKLAMISVSIMTVWMNLGFVYIVLLGGLNAVSDDIYDSLAIDGAGPLRKYGRVILPLISPSLFFIFIVSIIGSFQAFGQFHILTKGGPMNATSTIVYQIYQEAFVNYRFGTASAQALILFMGILLLTYIQFRVVEKKVHYQ